MSKYSSMDYDKPDWNMSGHWIDGLAFLKTSLVTSLMNGDLRTSIMILSQEIDWVSSDLGKEELKNFRRKIDSLRNIANRNMSTTVRNNLFVQLNNLKREVWDLELENDITRTKNTEDNSNKRMAGFE